MRRDIAFNTEDGVTLRGWHYVPDGRQEKVPTIVMAHCFSAVKEMYLAAALAAAKLASIVFDNRNFGAGDGTPRQEIDPWQQVRDYRDAITYAETLAEAGPERIGIWGTSYSGGHVLVVGAIDRRVKCVVAQVPLVSGHANIRRLIRADHLAGVQRVFAADRRARMAGKPPAMIPVVVDQSAAPCALPNPDSWSWFTETGRTIAPAWKNEVTLRSVEMFTEYEPGSYVRFISPTPLLMVVALGDVLTVPELALAAFEPGASAKAAGHPRWRALRCVRGRFRGTLNRGGGVVHLAPRANVARTSIMWVRAAREREHGKKAGRTVDVAEPLKSTGEEKMPGRQGVAAAFAATLGACSASTGGDEAAGIGLPSAVMGSLRHGDVRCATYDGISDDLLTAGLGKSGLAAPPPKIVDPLSPTAAELHRLAIYTNYRAIVDVSPGGGYGTLFGPNVLADGTVTMAEGKIPGSECLTYADDGSGRRNVTLMVQIPESFDPAPRVSSPVRRPAPAASTVPSAPAASGD